MFVEKMVQVGAAVSNPHRAPAVQTNLRVQAGVLVKMVHMVLVMPKTVIHRGQILTANMTIRFLQSPQIDRDLSAHFILGVGFQLGWYFVKKEAGYEAAGEADMLKV